MPALREPASLPLRSGSSANRRPLWPNWGERKRRQRVQQQSSSDRSEHGKRRLEVEMVQLVIVVPCFNEGRRLRAEGFRALLGDPGTRILFVDDGSSDDTREVLAHICRQLGPRALRLDLPRNAGKAEAVRQGLLTGLHMGALFIGFLDADLATPAEEMLRLVATLRGSRAQAAFGARVALL